MLCRVLVYCNFVMRHLVEMLSLKQMLCNKFP